MFTPRWIQQVARELYFAGYFSILFRRGCLGRPRGSLLHPLGLWWSLLVLFLVSFSILIIHPPPLSASECVKPADNRTHPHWKIFIDAMNYWCAEHCPQSPPPSKPLISIFSMVSIDALTCFIRNFESAICSILHTFGRPLMALNYVTTHFIPGVGSMRR